MPPLPPRSPQILSHYPISKLRKPFSAHAPTHPHPYDFILSGLFWLRSCVVSVLNAVRSVTSLRGFLLARFF